MRVSAEDPVYGHTPASHRRFGIDLIAAVESDRRSGEVAWYFVTRRMGAGAIGLMLMMHLHGGGFPRTFYRMNL